MNIQIQRNTDRGTNDIGWLKAKHSFSFGNYYDPANMGFGLLRVLNDDTIAPGAGFGTHPHNNMEIITIVLSGALEHKDSMENVGVIHPGEVQVMSAGSGVTHSEYNHLSDEPTSLFQIWIETKENNIQPRYDQKAFHIDDNSLVEVASGEDNDSLYIHQDAKILRGRYNKDKQINYTAKKGNGVFILVVDGEVRLQDEVLQTRDAARITDAEQVTLHTTSDSEILIIEVPMN